MVTHPGIAPPSISTALSFDESHGRYAPGTEFQIGRIDLVANTGTYVDTPAHRFRDGCGPGRGSCSRPCRSAGHRRGLPARGRRACRDRGAGSGRTRSTASTLRGRAVLVATGWDRLWGAAGYLSDNPFLTADAAALLVERGAALVGIDSLNVDSLADPARPAHTAILRAGIPLVEHLTGLTGLPSSGFRFFAVPPRIHEMGTFPVRAFAIVEG